LIETTFILDGISSVDFGLHIVRVGQSGLQDTPFIGGQSIIEETIPRRGMPFFYGTQKEPISFSVTFSTLDEDFDSEKLHALAKWLVHDEYKEFQTTDDLEKRYYVIMTNQADLYTSNLKNGYFTAEFRSNAPWAWSDIYRVEYDLSTIISETTINMENKSNIVKYYYPQLEIELLDDFVALPTGNTFTLTNSTDNNRLFEIDFDNSDGSVNTYLKGEKIYFNNENGRIIDDNPDVNIIRLNNFNKKWLRLPYGINKIKTSNKCKITTIMQYPIYQ